MPRVDHSLLARLLRSAADALEAGAAVEAPADEWVDQHSSPLGRRAHTAAIRSGALPGSKVGRRLLARRSDLDAYVLRHRVTATDEDDSDDGELSAELAAAIGE